MKQRESIWSRVVRGNFRMPPFSNDIVRELGSDEAYRITKDMQETVIYRAEAATRFDVQNVAEYFYAQNDQDEWTWAMDFPNMAPPFMLFWMEHGPCPGVRTERGFEPWDELSQGSGVLVTGMPADMAEQVFRVTDHVYQHHAEQLREKPDDAKWHLTFEIFNRVRGYGVIGPVSTITFWLGEDGRPRTDPLITLPMTETTAHLSNAERFEQFGGMAALLFPFAFALSLLHCKNVTVVDAPDGRTRQQRRQDERRGVPDPRFKTLVIDPMKRVLQTEGGVHQHGLKKALHICRGHFAHYSEEKPLFGKYAGTFWRPAHVRGSAEAGRIEKDYFVKAPRTGEAA